LQRWLQHAVEVPHEALEKVLKRVLELLEVEKMGSRRRESRIYREYLTIRSAFKIMHSVGLIAFQTKLF